jgi:hypothetical protein
MAAAWIRLARGAFESPSVRIVLPSNPREALTFDRPVSDFRGDEVRNCHQTVVGIGVSGSIS